MNDSRGFKRYVLVPRAPAGNGPVVRRFSLGRLPGRPARLGGERLDGDRLERLERVAELGQPRLS
jgi:hypothetical protein